MRIDWRDDYTPGSGFWEKDRLFVIKETVVKPYGTATGLGGSHTIDVRHVGVEIELLE